MIKIIFTTISVLIAGIMAWIARSQYLLSKNQLELSKQIAKLDSQKVKWELFEKRYKVYHLTKEILRELSWDYTITSDKLGVFNYEVRERIFLFDNDINEFIDSITTKGIELTLTTKKIKETTQPITDEEQWRDLINEQNSESRWFVFEYQSNVENRFLKYLNFRDLI